MLNNFQLLLTNVFQTALTMGYVVIALWVIHLVDTLLLRGALKKRFGIRPRTDFNPLSILISPLLHLNFGHLIANSVPLFVLGALVMMEGLLIFWLTTIVVILVAGLGIWFLGKPNTQHVGASGLILGYFGFIMASLFFSPDLATILVAAITAVLYLGLIWQVLPLKRGVSTTGHLFGFLGGIIAAGITLLLNTGG